jgi:site-specific recombinase XerD
MRDTRGRDVDRNAQIGSVHALRAQFKRSLLAENKSKSTIAVYTSAVDRFADYLDAHGMPVAVASLTRDHVESFIAYLLEHSKPATAANRYRALQAFFRWLTEEGEISESPMRNMRPPIIPEQPVPVLSDDEIKRLLKTCEGKRFEERRDMAILRLFIDSGLRRASRD